MMTPSRNDLREHFRSLADAYLLEVYGAGTLTALALEVASEELTRRGIAHVPRSLEDEDVTEPADEDPVILETVARSLMTSELEILRARLESEGIPSYVMDGNMNQAYSLIAPALGGARLQVPQEYAATAKEIIAALNSGVLAVRDGDDSSIE